MSISLEVVSKLIQIKAIKFDIKNPFIWSSGIESPIYCDNRVIWSYPGIRTFIIDQMVRKIHSIRDVNAIVGVATAGIAPASYVSREMALPLAYVRAKKKSHGMENQIEGRLRGDENVVVVEDLISTGGSSIRAAQALIEQGVNVSAVISIFSYNLSVAQSNFDKAQIQYMSLSNLDDLIELGLEEGFFKRKDVNKLIDWKKTVENRYKNGK